MATHEYTARQALKLLLQKVAARDVQLEGDIQSAIDAGRDAEEREPARGRNKTPRSYRKTVRFTDEEALRLAVSVLEAHFIEQPLFVRSATQHFAEVGIGEGVETQQDWPFEGSSQANLEGIGAAKTIEIELQTETQVVRSGAATISLETISDRSIDEQRDHVAKLYVLTDFDGR